MPLNSIKRELYGGEVIVEFAPERHRYTISGRKDFPISVTNATGIVDKSGPLIYWAVGLMADELREWVGSRGDLVSATDLMPVIDSARLAHKRTKDQAADIGSVVHDYAENYAKALIGQADMPQITPDMPAGALNGINAYLDWLKASKVAYIDAERILYSKEHDFVGLADAVARIDGKLMIVDYKTGKNIYSEARYQVAGYAIAYEEETGEKLDGAVIVNFNKQTGELLPENIVEISRAELEEYKAVFLACLTVRRSEKRLAKAER